MNGANHAATALVLKRYAPEAPLMLLLVGTALSDLLFSALVFGGIEVVSYSGEVRSFADVDLSLIPYSHSVLSGMLGGAALALIAFGWVRKSRVAVVFGIAVLSHIVLDMLVHKPDIPLDWAAGSASFGSGLYSIPVYAFFVEIGYLLFCLYIAQSSRKMLYWLLALNAATISMYVPAIPGPEYWYATYPWIFPTLVLLDTIAGIAVIYWVFTRQDHDRG